MGLLVVVQCRPIKASWDLSVEGECIHLNTAFIIFGSLNALTGTQLAIKAKISILITSLDIIALCLPMPFLWRLHTDKARKLQLIGVFSLGSLTCGVSLYRIPQMANLSLSDAPCKATIFFVSSSYIDNILGSDVKPCVWAVVEVCLAILGACLPTYPALFGWKSVRNQQRGRVPHSGSPDSSQYAVLTSDKPRSELGSGVGNGHESLRMT